MHVLFLFAAQHNQMLLMLIIRVLVAGGNIKQLYKSECGRKDIANYLLFSHLETVDIKLIFRRSLVTVLFDLGLPQEAINVLVLSFTSLKIMPSHFP